VLRHIASYISGEQPEQYGAFSCLDYRVHERNLLSILRGVEKHSNNRIWRAIVNHMPLMSQPSPGYWSHNSSEEAYFVLETGLPVWMMTEGAVDYLRKYCRETHGKLDYDCTRSRH